MATPIGCRIKMSDIPSRQFKFSAHKNNPDGTKIEVPIGQIKGEEMVLVNLIDKFVAKDDLREAVQVLKFIGEKK